MSRIELQSVFQRVIGTIGYAGAGKDEVVKQLGIPAVAFSDTLKEVCWPLAAYFGLNLDRREDKEKFREVLVAVGRLGRSIDPDFWIKRLVLPDAPTVAITGVRYLNECKAIQEVGGTLAFVVRPGVLPANEEEATSIQRIVKAAALGEIDVVQINNDGDTNTLRINAAAALDYPLHTIIGVALEDIPRDGTGLVSFGSVSNLAAAEEPTAFTAPWDDEEPHPEEGPTALRTWRESVTAHHAKIVTDENGSRWNWLLPYLPPEDYGPRSRSFEEIFGGPVTEEDAADGYCPVCGVHGCDLDPRNEQEPDHLPYVDRVLPSDVFVPAIEGHPLFCVNVIDGDDAVPFLKSLQGDFSDILIFRGSVPEGFDPGENGTVVLLPERDPEPYELAPVVFDVHAYARDMQRCLDLARIHVPPLEESSGVRALRRWFECDPEAFQAEPAGSVIEVTFTTDPQKAGLPGYYYHPERRQPWYRRLWDGFAYAPWWGQQS
jgi:hypothetical protein